MGETFVTYRAFNDKALATALYEQLKQGDIPVKWESDEQLFDVTFSNSVLLNYYVKLLPKDFNQANDLLVQSVTSNQVQPTADYYLYTFSDEELLEVLMKPSEWNEFDQYWAKNLLAERNVSLPVKEIEGARLEDAQQQREPWTLSPVVFLLVTLMIILSLCLYLEASLAMIGGGLFVGLIKRTLPDGTRIYAFSQSVRFYAMLVGIVGLVIFVFILLGVFRVTPRLI